MNLIEELATISATLREAQIPYAVCGGIAVTIHGAARTTRDIDLLVAAEHVQAIIALLRPLGYLFAALPMTFEEGTARERHVQRISKLADGEHLCVDLLITQAALSGLLDDTIEFEFEGTALTVISRAALIEMKRMAGRPQDQADLLRLAETPGDD